MLEVVAASAIGLFAQVGGQPASDRAIRLLSWQNAKFFQLPPEPDSQAESIVKQYLKDLATKGYNVKRQGIWLQSDLTRLATHNGQTVLSAASLTKIATTLVSIKKWGLDYQFETQFYADGEIQDGILNGDLVVTANNDPMFVWEEAYAVGNALNRLGIKRVTGNLVVSPNFYMNFYPNPKVAAEKLKEALNSKLWQQEAKTQHALMPPGTPRPTLQIDGGIKIDNPRPEGLRLLAFHRSPPLSQIIKQMNIYSNNTIAEILGELAGGGDAVAKQAAEIVGLPPSEIQLINGSGLGTANRMSPQMATAMYGAIARELEGKEISIADLFPVAGREKLGTMIDRRFPPNTLIKTGSLAQVSALAGILPTQKYGWVWFAIINEGGDISSLRVEQDRLLRRLADAWGTSSLPASPSGDNFNWGDPERVISE